MLNLFMGGRGQHISHINCNQLNPPSIWQALFGQAAKKEALVP